MSNITAAGYEDMLCIEGGYSSSSGSTWQFCSILGSIWVVFRQKNNRLTAQSVIVNC